jgi:hypothetical protein
MIWRIPLPVPSMLALLLGLQISLVVWAGYLGLAFGEAVADQPEDAAPEPGAAYRRMAGAAWLLWWLLLGAWLLMLWLHPAWLPGLVGAVAQVLSGWMLWIPRQDLARFDRA